MKNVENIIIRRSCLFCGEQNEISVPTIDFMRWQGGVLIQHAMPYLTPTNREFLISGTCRKCQEVYFGGDEED